MVLINQHKLKCRMITTMRINKVIGYKVIGYTTSHTLVICEESAPPLILNLDWQITSHILSTRKEWQITSHILSTRKERVV